MTFNEWLRKRWYVGVILAGVCAAFAQMFITSTHATTVGLVMAYVLTYLIYASQNSSTMDDKNEERHDKQN
jgi:membrane protein YqaA with SNARE-associated domain